jgi:hypothetical protein
LGPKNAGLRGPALQIRTLEAFFQRIASTAQIAIAAQLTATDVGTTASNYSQVVP